MAVSSACKCHDNGFWIGDKITVRVRVGPLKSITRIAMNQTSQCRGQSVEAVKAMDTQCFVHLSCQQTVKLSTQIGR